MAERTPSRRDLERIVRGFVAIGAKLDSSVAIPIDETAPRPQEPYCSLGMINDVRIGWPESYSVRDAQGELVSHRTVSRRQAEYDVHFYHDVSRADLFADWMQSPEGVKEAAARKLRVTQYGDVKRMDEIVQDMWEPRCVVSLRIAYNAVYEDSITALEPERIVISHDKGDEEITP